MKRKLFSVFNLFVLCIGAIAQTTLINPTGNGGFENGSTFASNNWTVVNHGAGTRSWYVGSGMTGFSGTNAAFIGDNATTTSTVTASTLVHFYKSVTIPAGATNIVLSFKYKQTVGDNTYDFLKVFMNGNVPVSGVTETAGNIVTVDPPNTANSYSVFTSVTTTISNSFAGATNNLIFSFRADGFSPHAYGGVDDISLTYIIPTCFSPTGLNAFAGFTTATFTWTPGATESAWDVYYGSSIAAPTATTVPTATVSVPSYTATGLTSATNYSVYVRANCGSGDLSSWTPVNAFATTCSAANIPYIQDFESITAPAIPSCNSVENLGTGNTWNTVNLETAGFTGNTLQYKYNGSNPANTWYYTQGLNLTGGISYRLTYKYSSSATTYTESLNVNYGMSANAAAMTNTLINDPIINNGGPALIKTIDFTPATSGVYYIGFHCYSDIDQAFLYIDDINVYITPTCVEPTALTASNISATSVELGWTAPTIGTPVNYQWEIRTSGAPGTAGATASGTVSATTLSVTTSLLSANTTYSTYVRTDCGNGDNSFWTLATKFKTPCTATNIPYVEDFESITAPAIPSCNSVENLGTGNTWNTVNLGAVGFTGNALQYKYNGSNPANTWYYTQGLNLTGGTSYRLTYKYSSSAVTFTESLNVNYGMSANAAAMTNTLINDPIINNGGPALTKTIDFTPATSSVYYIGFHCYSAKDQAFLYIDDINVNLSTVTGINELASSNNINVYPNPNNGIVNISIASELVNNASVEMYDALGKLILVESLTKNINAINTSKLDNGMYFYKIISNKQEVKVGRMIKQ